MYVPEALVKGLAIWSMESLLRGVSNLVNGYMSVILVKRFANLINAVFVKRGF